MINRFACNELDFTPADIIRNLYGHACGDNDFSDRCGSENGIVTVGRTPYRNGENTGACKYGAKKQGYLLDTFWSSTTSIGRFRQFASFVSYTFVSSLFQIV